MTLLRVFALLVLPLSLVAQIPMVTDRPDQTESTVTVPRGMLQFETGAERDHTEALTVGSTLLRYGLHPRFEARLGFGGYQRSGGISGVGDADVGFKLGLGREGALIDVAWLGAVSLPTGSDAFTTDQVDPSTRIALAMPINSRVSFGANAGVTWTAGRADGLYTAVLGFSLTDRLGMFAESFGSLPVSDGGVAAHLVDGGFTLGLTPTLQLDASGGVGISAGAADWFLGLGVSARIGTTN
jgi:hypothetical protein